MTNQKSNPDPAGGLVYRNEAIGKLAAFVRDVEPVVQPDSLNTSRRKPIFEGMASPRGGAGRGQGRKPTGEASLDGSINVRLTREQRAKLAQLGGAAWLRKQIDSAKEPA